ncbi:SPOR domain-containing protein [Lysobacter yananisis]|uniref:Sporulation and cell division repeat protein n=2 Tax=Lysobacter TaxID=68 RepID=A0A0S2DDM3_LYSEN|nr:MULTISPECIES: SPOR domain-containing protein [Lysobacter]ALN56694.1 sporulation and cell division repeat protein [Lysobacter enzymogenes]QCW25469.1 sporulation protein [Lysobacter enzymogenes]WMT03247.1 SPOR domain-containing protein [Lysobacter yananisis]
MEPALKQRLIGALVLVALAVIFLPMLIKGPAPESGASDVPLTLPDQPQGGQGETRELPLVTPGDAPQDGMVGMERPQPEPGAAAPAGNGQTLPTVDTAAGRQGMQPAAAAGGDYAVSFGSYASAGDADRVIAALQAARLPGYQETAAGANGRTVYRVRIGPFATQADAEAARLNSTKVRNDINAKVVVLNADAADLASGPAPAPAKPASTPAPLNDTKPAKPAALPPEPAKPVAAKPAEPKPTEPKPAKPADTKPVAAAKPVETKPLEPAKPVEKPAAKPEPAKPAAAGTGFAVQLGAFGNAEEANKLRDRARAAGFSAFVEQVRTDKGTLNRVRIGPVVNRADADKLKGQVGSKLGIGDALVKPHP